MSVFAVYGGSFAPPHDGHRRALKLLIEQEFLNGVVFLPAGGNPFKEQVTLPLDREKLISEWFVDVMIELDAKKVSESQWSLPKKSLILDLQSLRDKESSTFRSLERLEDCKLADELVIAIGSDLVNEVESWQFTEQLTQSYCFVVIPRGGYERVFPGNFRELPLDLSNFEPCELSSTMLKKKNHRSYE